MGANGKGNGKRHRSGASEPPERAEGGPTNGKGKGVAAASAPAAEEAHVEAHGEPEGEAEARGEEGAEPAAPPAAEPAPAPAHAPAVTAEEAPRGAAWAAPIARFEAKWTWLESRLLTFVLVWQVLALVAWVFLNGLSESVATTAGAVFRAVLFAIALGLAGWLAPRGAPEERRRNLSLAGIAIGVAVVLAWRRLAASGGAGARLDVATVGYFDNIKGWLQEGSTLTLLGGLRGLGTRLTLWLALLGGSLATAAGKHIHVDVVFRFLPKRLRVPAAVTNYLVAAAVCAAAVWGFFDHIAIESYGSKADDRAGAKIDNALHHIGQHAFFTRKQIGLDLRSLPHVLAGERYDQWMSAKTWNEWVDGAGFEERFDPAKARNLRIPEDGGTHPPFVVSPEGETTRGALAHTLGLVFPFGLLAIALRFLLRAILTLSGHVSADPDEAHKEELRGAAEGGA
jgi:TRAP-type C4-dicarboxylate transport system permease small subunit